VLASAPALAQTPAELPQSPSLGRPQPTSFRDELRLGMEATPPCAPDLRPCTLSSQQKFQRFLKRTYSPYTFIGAGLDAGYSQLTQEDYGHGWAGFGKRYGANVADGESRSFFQTFVYASMFRQDPRYCRMGDGDFARRFSYAATRVLFGRSDDGGRKFNYPELLGSATASSLSNLYYPDRDRGLGRTLSRAFGYMLSDAGSNAFKEFWPDIRNMLKRHEPDRVQRFENKINGMRLARDHKGPNTPPAGETNKD